MLSQCKLAKTQARCQLLLNEINALRQRLERFKQENLTNQQPIEAEFRLDAGFGTYEAGIMESKQVFFLHRIKVRSEPTIFLQERIALFAANFIRWATLWLAEQPQPQENALDIRKLGIKRQVQVGAHVSARVIRDSESMLLKFSEHSAFSGKVLKLQNGGHPPHSRQKF